MATTTPVLTPGRSDKLGHMQVPHDIFVYVTTTAGWASSIDSYVPATRKPYLDAIKYWMDLNGACIIRSASSSRFAAIKDITQCATILYGRQNVDGNTVPPAVSAFTLAVSPTSGTLPLATVVTLVAASTHTAGSVEVNWGDGTAVSNVIIAAGETKTAGHTYATGTGPSKTISAIAKDAGATVGTAKTQAMTLTEPAVSNFTLSVTPTTGTLPLDTVVTLVAGASHNTSTIEVNWGDGTAVSSVAVAGGQTKTASHTYATGTGPTKTISAQAKNGATSVGAAKTQVMTLN